MHSSINIPPYRSGPTKTPGPHPAPPPGAPLGMPMHVPSHVGGGGHMPHGGQQPMPYPGGGFRHGQPGQSHNHPPPPPRGGGGGPRGTPPQGPHPYGTSPTTGPTLPSQQVRRGCVTAWLCVGSLRLPCLYACIVSMYLCLHSIRLSSFLWFSPYASAGRNASLLGAASRAFRYGGAFCFVREEAAP